MGERRQRCALDSRHHIAQCDEVAEKKGKGRAKEVAVEQLVGRRSCIMKVRMRMKVRVRMRMRMRMKIRLRMRMRMPQEQVFINRPPSPFTTTTWVNC